MKHETLHVTIQKETDKQKRSMIKSFKHKGLKNFFYENKIKGINSNHSKKLMKILQTLNRAVTIQDLNKPGYRLHSYTNQKDLWSIDVNGNSRILFDFKDSNACVVDYLGPH